MQSMYRATGINYSQLPKLPEESQMRRQKQSIRMYLIFDLKPISDPLEPDGVIHW